MKCKDCKHLNKFANSDTCRLGICDIQFMQRHLDSDCIYIPKPYTCGDCMHLIENDTACMTAKETDSAYNDGKLCSGFISEAEDKIKNGIRELYLRKEPVDKLLEKWYNEIVSESRPILELMENNNE